METNLAAEHLNGRLEQNHGRGPVHVIVAVDQDGFAARDRRLHPGGGRVHAMHRVWVEQVFQAGVKKVLSLGSAAHPALGQQLRYDQRKPGARGQRGCA